MPIDALSSSQATQPLQRISSGQRINSAKDDAVGLAIADRFSSQERGLNVAIRNSVDGISLLETEGGALGSVTEDLQRIRELSVQSLNGILNDSDREAINLEVQQLTSNISETLENTEFNGKSLFESGTDVFQVGANVGETIDIQRQDIRSNLESSGFSFEGNQSFDLETLDNALAVINTRQTEIGAVQNRLEQTVQAQGIKRENAAEARSRITDADIAAETARQSSNDVREQATIAIQAQANENQGRVLQLLS